MPPPSHPVRVLVVDDDTMSRELLGVLLESEGCTVESADSGESALALLRTTAPPPDVILSDVNMPGIAGAALAHRLRAACGPATLLFAMSGTAQPESALSAFDGFLLKPFTMQQFADALAAPRTQISTSNPATVHTSAPQGASKPSMQQVQNPPFSPEAAAAAPVLNESIYEKLACSMPSGQLQELYLLCVNDARKRINVMRGLVAAHDADRFVREAHTIKGSCGMLGATQLHGMAAELEQRGLDTAGSHEAEEVNSLDELSAACDRLERMLGSRV